MSTIISGLEEEHAIIRSFLDMFDDELAAFRSGGEPDYAVIDMLLDYFTSFPDEWHHHKEDYVFDVLRAKLGPAEGMDDLRQEHARLEDGVRRFAERIAHLRLGRELPLETLLADGERYAQHLRAHLAKEEEWFFPLAGARLSADDWRAIETALARAAAEPERAQTLRRIAELETHLSEAVAERSAAAGR